MRLIYLYAVIVGVSVIFAALISNFAQAKVRTVQVGQYNLSGKVSKFCKGAAPTSMVAIDRHNVGTTKLLVTCGGRLVEVPINANDR